MRRARAIVAAVVLPGLALTCTGCNKKIHLPEVLNQRPIVNLTQSPAGGDTRYFYSYELRWSGYDHLYGKRISRYVRILIVLSPMASRVAFLKVRETGSVAAGRG